MVKVNKCITYGTFDLLHVGHIRLLRRIKKHCKYLVVGLSSDEFNIKKGKESFFCFEQRKEILLACKYVDEVIEEKSWEQKIEDIKINEIDRFVIGDDWNGKFDYLSEFCEVKYLERTENISTSKIKNDLNKIDEEKLKELESLVKNMYQVIHLLK